MAGPYDLQTSLNGLEALRVHLAHERWLVAGHSWGAFLAYALEFLERTGAVTHLSGAGIQNDRHWHEAQGTGWTAGLEQELDFAVPTEHRGQPSGERIIARVHEAPMLLRRIAELEVPVLAAYGGVDIRPGWSVEQLANLLPNATFELIEGAGHNLWLAHADELRSLLRPFVRSQHTTGAR